MQSRDFLLKHILSNFEKSNAAPKVTEKRIHKSVDKLLLANAQPSTKKIEVGIIGAGMSGLFSALLLKELGISCTILERDDRVGGRVFTKYYDDQPWQYVEVGAMRIPAKHAYFYRLVDYLKNAGIDLKTIPYNFTDPEKKNLRFFNGTRNGKDIMTEAFAKAHPETLGFPNIIQVSAKEELESPEPDGIKVFLRKDLTKERRDRWSNVSALYDSIFVKLNLDFDEFGEKEFINRYDRWTTSDWFDYQIRAWITEDSHDVPPELTITTLVNAVRHYAEVTDSATGLNNLALVEAVLDGRNFADTPGEPTWRTIEGGMQKLPDAMAKLLENSCCEIKKNASVYRLVPLPHGKAAVSWLDKEGKSFTKEFDRVIVTAPFGAIRYWEMPQFSYLKRQAIRSLNYDHSTKIFLRFKNRFWEHPTSKHQMQGGSTKTDLPVRTVVYPSYGLGDTGKGVLLASYTWATDAIRWSLLTDEELKRVCINNLAILHERTDLDTQITEEKPTVQKWYEAFALFGPRQLMDLLIPGMRPEQHIHFAGEHLSTSHAWIIGALFSAHRAVKEILALENLSSKPIEHWNEGSEWHENDIESNWFHWITWLRKERHLYNN